MLASVLAGRDGELPGSGALPEKAAGELMWLVDLGL